MKERAARVREWLAKDLICKGLWKSTSSNVAEILAQHTYTGELPLVRVWVFLGVSLHALVPSSSWIDHVLRASGRATRALLSARMGGVCRGVHDPLMSIHW